MSFLAGAIEAGEVAAFEDYARWTRGVLASRGIAGEHLAENLRQVGDALAAHLDPATYAVVLGLVGAGARVAFLTGDEAVVEAGEGDVTARLYLQAALLGHRAAAVNVLLDARRLGRPLAELYVDVVQAAQVEIGRLWAANRITVAEEHRATAVSQFVVTKLYDLLERAPGARGRLVLTGVEGEHHQLGAQMAADVLEADGWDVQFLGTNMPHAGIVKAIREHGAHVLGVSATLLVNLPAARQLAEEVRAALGDAAPALLLGGRAFASATRVASELDAIGVAVDLAGALALTRGVGGPTGARA